MDLEFILNQLDILPVRSLKHHEERISLNFSRLKETMLNLGLLVDPLIVDRKTKVVLDGNHRLKVLETIRVPNAVCQVVDYMSDEIRVGTWYLYLDSFSPSEAKELGFSVESVDESEGFRTLDSLGAAFMLASGDGCYLLSPGSYDIDGLIEAQKEIVSKLEKSKTVTYEKDTDFSTAVSEGKSVLARRCFSKSEIIDRALNGKEFPAKSTRHLVPNRIIRLNMRLGWLHQSRDEAWNHLKGRLMDRVYEGNVRRYVEPVIVIY